MQLPRNYFKIHWLSVCVCVCVIIWRLYRMPILYIHLTERVRILYCILFVMLNGCIFTEFINPVFFFVWCLQSNGASV